jgi:hypothetical protein
MFLKNQRVETRSWLTYHFYKVVFLTVVSARIYSPAHGMHAVKITWCILQGDFYTQLIIAGEEWQTQV